MRLLLDMALVETGGRRSRLVASGKKRSLRRDIELREDLFDAPVDKGPGAHILRLLLAPDDLGVAVALQHFGQRIERERIELLNPHQRDALLSALGAVLCQIEIDLARAQHDAAHCVIRSDIAALADDAME